MKKLQEIYSNLKKRRLKQSISDILVGIVTIAIIAIAVTGVFDVKAPTTQNAVANAENLTQADGLKDDAEDLSNDTAYSEPSEMAVPQDSSQNGNSYSEENSLDKPMLMGLPKREILSSDQSEDMPDDTSRVLDDSDNTTLPQNKTDVPSAESDDTPVGDNSSSDSLDGVTPPQKTTADVSSTQMDEEDTTDEEVTVDTEPNYDIEIPEGEPLVITMTVTAYCPGACCNGAKYAGVTASGAEMQLWHTVASGFAYPFGTRIYIPYFADQPNGGWFVVEDRFKKEYCNNPYILDVLMENDEVCNEFGRRELEVYVYFM